MWSTEKQFGKMIMNKMKQEGLVPIRIETAQTVSGMPDMYVLGHNSNDWFIELKNIKGKINSKCWKIPWRPGQQAWAQQYATCHIRGICKEFLSVKYSWTFVGLDDGVLLIRMSCYRNDAKVLADDYSVFKFSLSEFKKLSLQWFLRTHSQVITPILHKDMTWGQLVYRQLKFDIEEVLGHRYLDVDIPAPEDVIDEVAPELKDKLKSVISPLERLDSTAMGWLQRNIAEQACSIYRSYITNEISMR